MECTVASFRFSGLDLPAGQQRQAILDSLSTVRIGGGSPDELRGYLLADFDRFLYTLALAPDEGGRALEIGASPYLMTALLRMMRPGYTMDLVNYFAAEGEVLEQDVHWSCVSGRERSEVFRSFNVNIEEAPLPVADGTYDLVLFCEVLEHFTGHPLRAVNELWRVMKPGGTLILTTPNVARFANVAALLEGRNLYDPYSGYGPHGRHNREYCRHELHQLMTHSGFTAEYDFTSDVHPNGDSRVPADVLHSFISMIPNREHDLGQYLFSRWRKTHRAESKLPRWLYRSHPEEAFA